MRQAKGPGGNHTDMSALQASVCETTAAELGLMACCVFIPVRFHFIFCFLLRTVSKSTTINPQMQIFIRLVMTASPILPDNSKCVIRKIQQTTVTQFGTFIYV